MLANGERGVTSIITDLKLGQPTVSHHLALLRSARLIRAVREGKQITYFLEQTVKMTGNSFWIGPFEIVSNW